MSDLKSVFDDSVSAIVSKEDASREAGKRKIEDRGVKEIMEYIVERINLPLSQKTDNDRRLTEGIVNIAEKRFYSQNRTELDGPLKNVELKETESEDRMWHVIYISALFDDSSDWTNVSKMTLGVFASSRPKDLLIWRGDNDGKFFNILPEDTKEVILQKIIKLILNGRIG